MKKLHLISILLISILFSGCIQPDKQGLVLEIDEQELSQSFKESFPFEKDFLFGSLSLNEPTIKMHKTQNRVKAGVNLGLKTVFTSAIRGNFFISGEPIFNKKESAIYLKNVKLESFNFGRLKMSSEFTDNFRTSIEPMINQIFKQYPIYKIPQDSILGNFVKDVKIGNSNLLVTYGI